MNWYFKHEIISMNIALALSISFIDHDIVAVFFSTSSLISHLWNKHLSFYMSEFSYGTWDPKPLDKKDLLFNQTFQSNGEVKGFIFCPIAHDILEPTTKTSNKIYNAIGMLWINWSLPDLSVYVFIAYIGELSGSFIHTQSRDTHDSDIYAPEAILYPNST